MYVIGAVYFWCLCLLASFYGAAICTEDVMFIAKGIIPDLHRLYKRAPVNKVRLSRAFWTCCLNLSLHLGCAYAVSNTVANSTSLASGLTNFAVIFIVLVRTYYLGQCGGAERREAASGVIVDRRIADRRSTYLACSSEHSFSSLLSPRAAPLDGPQELDKKVAEALNLRPTEKTATAAEPSANKAKGQRRVAVRCGRYSEVEVGILFPATSAWPIGLANPYPSGNDLDLYTP